VWTGLHLNVRHFNALMDRSLGLMGVFQSPISQQTGRQTVLA